MLMNCSIIFRTKIKCNLKMKLIYKDVSDNIGSFKTILTLSPLFDVVCVLQVTVGEQY